MEKKDDTLLSLKNFRSEKLPGVFLEEAIQTILSSLDCPDVKDFIGTYGIEGVLELHVDDYLKIKIGGSSTLYPQMLRSYLITVLRFEFERRNRRMNGAKGTDVVGIKPRKLGLDDEFRLRIAEEIKGFDFYPDTIGEEELFSWIACVRAKLLDGMNIGNAIESVVSTLSEATMDKLASTGCKESFTGKIGMFLVRIFTICQSCQRFL